MSSIDSLYGEWIGKPGDKFTQGLEHSYDRNKPFARGSCISAPKTNSGWRDSFIFRRRFFDDVDLLVY